MPTPWLTPALLEHARRSPGLPALELREAELSPQYSRRDLLRLAGAGALLCGSASAPAALVFENKPSAPASAPAPLVAASASLKLGEIPADFWDRPRSLKLRRLGTSDSIDVVYWKDGQLIADGYWKACALLRDVRANRMTYMDPVVLDVLRGILGYYEAWNWTRPLTATSGFRTEATNRALSKEGAARNSMHLYGKAADITMQGIDPSNLARLALHLRTGGVGFYPARNFVHVDTGKERYWQGR